MVSLTFSAGLEALSRSWHPRFDGWTTMACTIDVTVGIVLSTTVFAMNYKLIPRMDIDRKDVWIGALVNSLLLIASNSRSECAWGKMGSARALSQQGPSWWSCYGSITSPRPFCSARNSPGPIPANSARGNEIQPTGRGL